MIHISKKVNEFYFELFNFSSWRSIYSKIKHNDFWNNILDKNDYFFNHKYIKFEDYYEDTQEVKSILEIIMDSSYKNTIFWDTILSKFDKLKKYFKMKDDNNNLLWHKIKGDIFSDSFWDKIIIKQDDFFKLWEIKNNKDIMVWKIIVESVKFNNFWILLSKKPKEFFEEWGNHDKDTIWHLILNKQYSANFWNEIIKNNNDFFDMNAWKKRDNNGNTLWHLIPKFIKSDIFWNNMKEKNDDFFEVWKNKNSDNFTVWHIFLDNIKKSYYYDSKNDGMIDFILNILERDSILKDWKIKNNNSDTVWHFLAEKNNSIFNKTVAEKSYIFSDDWAIENSSNKNAWYHTISENTPNIFWDSIVDYNNDYFKKWLNKDNKNILWKDAVTKINNDNFWEKISLKGDNFFELWEIKDNDNNSGWHFIAKKEFESSKPNQKVLNKIPHKFWENLSKKGYSSFNFWKSQNNENDSIWHIFSTNPNFSSFIDNLIKVMDNNQINELFELWKNKNNHSCTMALSCFKFIIQIIIKYYN
jgi:hypothetical protein